MHIFLACVISCLVGIYSQCHNIYSTSFLFSIILLFGKIAKYNKYNIFLLLAFFSFGALRYYQANISYDIASHLFINEKSTDYIGYVYDINHMHNHCDKNYKTCITFLIKNPKNLKSYIKIYCTDKINVSIGTMLKIHNLKIRPNNKTQIIRDQIYGNSFAYKLNYQILQKPRYWDILSQLKNLRNSIDLRLKSKLNIQTYNLFSQIFLGKYEQNPTGEYNRNRFKFWGIFHYLARSGLHVNFLISLMSSLFKYIPVDFFLKKIISILLILIYSLLTWPSTSFNRSYNTFLLYQIFIFTKQPISIDHIFTLVTFTTLIYDPFLLFSLDFQLSYGLTMALILFNKTYTS